MDNVNQDILVSNCEKQADLFKILGVLWSKKLTVVLFTVTIGFFGGLYAYLAQPWWTSNATVTTVRAYDFFPIKEAIVNYYVVTKNEHASLNKLNDTLNSEKVFRSFLNEFNSYDNKITFLKSSSTIKADMKANNIETDEAKVQFYNGWVEKIQSSILDEKRKDIYQLSFQSKTKQSSALLLSDYISFISELVSNDIFKNISSEIGNKKTMLAVELSQLEEQAKNKRLNALKFTQYSYEIAKAADTSKPIPLFSDGSPFSIEIGSKGLAEKERLLKTMDSLDLFEPRIQTVKNDISLLDNIKLSDVNHVLPFAYLKSVSQPLGKDKPKRGLIVLVSIFLGMVLGSVFVLGNALIKDEL